MLTTNSLSLLSDAIIRRCHWAQLRNLMTENFCFNGDILLTATSCWLEQLFFRFMKYSPSYRSNVKIKLDNVPKHPSFCPWIPAACNAAWRVSLAKVNPRLHLQFLDDFKKNIRVGWQNPTRMAISQNINNLWFLEDSKIFLLHTPL